MIKFALNHLATRDIARNSAITDAKKKKLAQLIKIVRAKENF